jgi:hypothetical protein
MHIETPTTIEQVAWEGNLVALGQTFAGGETPARVTLGEPVWWAAEEAMTSATGKPWTPPADSRKYILARFACTLYPLSDPHARFSEATLTVYLRPRTGDSKVVAHALFPERMMIDQAGKITAKLVPELKFSSVVDVKGLELGTEIAYHKVFPTIQAFGLGESQPSWQFTGNAQKVVE